MDPSRENLSPRTTKRELLLHLRPLTSIHDLSRIDGVLVDLLLGNLPIFADEEVHPPRRLIFVFVDSVFAGNFAAPVAQQGKGHSDLVSKCFVGEGTVHAHTQDLGVGSFQLLQVLLEVFHLLRSTPSEGKHIKGQHHVLLPVVVAEMNVFQVVTIPVLQFEIRRRIAYAKLELVTTRLSQRAARQWHREHHRDRTSRKKTVASKSSHNTSAPKSLSGCDSDDNRKDALLTIAKHG